MRLPASRTTAKTSGSIVVERLALLEPAPELGRLGLQLVVGERRHLRLERVDGSSRAPQARDLSLVTVNDRFEKRHGTALTARCPNPVTAPGDV